MEPADRDGPPGGRAAVGGRQPAAAPGESVTAPTPSAGTPQPASGFEEASTHRTPDGDGLHVTGATVGREEPGRYRLVRELARGGQGMVHVAWDNHLGREVAFKQLLRQHEGGPDGTLSPAEARFVREARITAQLEHPGIAPLFEVGRRADGSLYATQRLIRGRTFAAVLADCKTLDDRLRLIEPLKAVCEIMAYAHERGVIHRDLKPGNVLVGDQGQVVVLDWGLGRTAAEAPEPIAGEQKVDSLLETGAARTQAGAILGTPAYMSPEQAVGAGSADARSDVWSLGVMLYEVLAGSRPFEGRSSYDLLRKVATEAPRPLSVASPQAPAALAKAAEKALSKDPAQRFPSVAALAAVLGDWLERRRASGPVRAVLQRVRARPLSSAAALLLLVAGTSTAVDWLRSGRGHFWWTRQRIDSEAARLLEEGIDLVKKGDPAGGAERLGRCALLQPSREVLARCLKNQGVALARAGDNDRAAEALEAYLPFCEGKDECASIEAAISRFGGGPPEITHQALVGPAQAGHELTLRAKIQSGKGIAVAAVFFRSSGANKSLMLPLHLKGSSDEYEAIVPAIHAHGQGEYLLVAKDNKNRQTNLGDGTPDTWFKVTFDDAAVQAGADAGTAPGGDKP